MGGAQCRSSSSNDIIKSSNVSPKHDDFQSIGAIKVNEEPLPIDFENQISSKSKGVEEFINIIEDDYNYYDYPSVQFPPPDPSTQYYDGGEIEYSNDSYSYNHESEEFIGEQPALPTVDTENLTDEMIWKALANATTDEEIDYYSIYADAKDARGVILEIFQGSYQPDLILQLDWAYKFNLLKEAVKDCYINGGDFYDSSRYDNCNGIPRYFREGLIEWVKDLQSQRRNITKKLEAKLDLGMDEVHVGQDSNSALYAKLELLLIARDQHGLLSGLLERKKQVELELERLHARVLAVVSVEGGPTRESMDNVFRLFKDQLIGDESSTMGSEPQSAIKPLTSPTSNSEGDDFSESSYSSDNSHSSYSKSISHASNVNESDDDEVGKKGKQKSGTMDQEEVEEEISNQLQDRHKFVVDFIVDVVVLEDELDSLTRQILQVTDQIDRQNEQLSEAHLAGSDANAHEDKSVAAVEPWNIDDYDDELPVEEVIFDDDIGIAPDVRKTSDVYEYGEENGEKCPDLSPKHPNKSDQETTTFELENEKVRNAEMDARKEAESNELAHEMDLKHLAAMVLEHRLQMEQAEKMLSDQKNRALQSLQNRLKLRNQQKSTNATSLTVMETTDEVQDFSIKSIESEPPVSPTEFNNQSDVDVDGGRTLEEIENEFEQAKKKLLEEFEEKIKQLEASIIMRHKETNAAKAAQIQSKSSNIEGFNAIEGTEQGIIHFVELLKQKQREDWEQLEATLMVQKEQQSKAIKDRIEQRKLRGLQQLQQQQGASPNDVEETQTIELEEQNELDGLETEFSQKLKDIREEQLEQFRRLIEEEADRLESKLHNEDTMNESKPKRIEDKSLDTVRAFGEMDEESRKGTDRVDLEDEVIEAGVTIAPMIPVLKPKKSFTQKVKVHVGDEVSEEVSEGKLRDGRVSGNKGVDEEEAIASDEQRILLESTMVEASKNIRALALASIQSQHREEYERLESELESQRTKRIKDLKERLELKKAERVKELMHSDGSTDNTNIHRNTLVAVSVATHELEAIGQLERAKIDDEINAAEELLRQNILNKLKKINEKESLKLKENLLEQEKIQRNILKNKLEKKKLQQQQKLQEAEKKMSGDVYSRFAKKMEQELKDEELQNKEELENSLKELKLEYEVEATKLGDILKWNKANDQKRLEERLLKRKLDRKKQNESHAVVPAPLDTELDFMSKPPVGMKDSSFLISTEDTTLSASPTVAAARGSISRSSMVERLMNVATESMPHWLHTSNKAPSSKSLLNENASMEPTASSTMVTNQDTITPQPPSVLVKKSSVLSMVSRSKRVDGGMNAKEYLNKVKAQQDHLLERVELLIRTKKMAMMKSTFKNKGIDSLSIERMKSSRESPKSIKASFQQSSMSKQKLAELSIYFDQLHEFLVVGLKKQFLYKTKAIKSYVKNQNRRRRQSREGLGPEDIAQLESIEFHHTSCDEAMDKVLNRFYRDVGGLLETQQSEKKSIVSEMKENCVSEEKVWEEEKNFELQCQESISNELLKALMIISGLRLDPSILDVPHDETGVRRMGDDMPLDTLSDEEEDDIESDDEEKVEKKGSKLKKKRLPNDPLFKEEALNWFDFIILDLIRKFSTAPLKYSHSFDAFTFASITKMYGLTSQYRPGTMLMLETYRECKYKVEQTLSAVALKSFHQLIYGFKYKDVFHRDFDVKGLMVHVTMSTEMAFKSFETSIQQQIANLKNTSEDPNEAVTLYMTIQDIMKRYIVESNRNIRKYIELRPENNDLLNDITKSISEVGIGVKNTIIDYLKQPLYAIDELNDQKAQHNRKYQEFIDTCLNPTEVKTAKVVNELNVKVVSNDHGSGSSVNLEGDKTHSNVMMVDKKWKEREEMLLKALELNMERKRRDIRELYRQKRRDQGDDGLILDQQMDRELSHMDQCLEDIANLIKLSDGVNLDLNKINADGLVAAVEKRMLGEDISMEQMVILQNEIDVKKATEREQKEVQRVLQKATESISQLDVALKLEKAKQHQALQMRLRNRKTVLK